MLRAVVPGDGRKPLKLQHRESSMCTVHLKGEGTMRFPGASQLASSLREPAMAVEARMKSRWLPCNVVGPEVAMICALNLLGMVVAARSAGAFCQSPPIMKGA